MKFNKSISYLLAASLPLLCSCGGGDDAPAGEGGGGQGGGNIAGNTELTLSANTTDILKNPMNGWVMYVSGSADPSYFDKQIYLSELGKNVYVRD